MTMDSMDVVSEWNVIKVDDVIVCKLAANILLSGKLTRCLADAAQTNSVPASY